MGASVAIAAFLDTSLPSIHGLILVAPAVRSRNTFKIYERILLTVGNVIAPNYRVSNSKLKIKLSDNLDMLRQRKSDPILINKSKVCVLNGVVNLMDYAYSESDRLNIPLIVLQGEKDELISKDHVTKFFKKLPLNSTRLQKIVFFDDGYHMLLRDLGAARVWNTIVDWIENSEPQ